MRFGTWPRSSNLFKLLRHTAQFGYLALTDIKESLPS